MMDPGKILEETRNKTAFWRYLFYLVLAVLVGANFFIHPHHPHFGLDRYPGFFALFGLSAGFAMVWLMKKIVQPLIARKEDFYGDL